MHGRIDVRLEHRTHIFFFFFAFWKVLIFPVPDDFGIFVKVEIKGTPPHTNTYPVYIVL